jgi:sterol desaturase/sphingolipid hydroxylase (fatty acid hydroxylase superfamily)
MSLLWILILVLASSGVMFFGVQAAWNSSRLESFRIRPNMSRKVKGAKLYKRVGGNLVMSGALVFILTYGAGGWLIDDTESFGIGKVLLALAILLVYDFFYYLLHRFAFHGVGWLKKVHAVHHIVRAPTAIESLFLHPMETFLGQFLLTVVACVMGPLDPLTWGLILFVHSNLNIIVHAGLDIPVPGLRLLSALARKHATHHVSMRGGNFASLTPLWDMMFGTAE